MPELVKLLGHFFRRDLLYLMAGSIFVSVFFFAIYSAKVPELPQYEIVVLLFVAYICGYTLQEVAAVIHLVCIRDVYPSNICFWIFNSCVAGLDVTEIAGLDVTELDNPVSATSSTVPANETKIEETKADKKARENKEKLGSLQRLNDRYWNNSKELGQRASDQIERFLILRQIASSFGPSLVASAILYFVLSGYSSGFSFSKFEWTLMGSSLCAGLFLCAQTYYRATQVAVHLAILFRDPKRNLNAGE